MNNHIKSLEEIIQEIKYKERERKKKLAKLGRNEFKKKGRK